MKERIKAESSRDAASFAGFVAVTALLIGAKESAPTEIFGGFDGF